MTHQKQTSSLSSALLSMKNTSQGKWFHKANRAWKQPFSPKVVTGRRCKGVSTFFKESLNNRKKKRKKATLNNTRNHKSLWMQKHKGRVTLKNLRCKFRTWTVSRWLETSYINSNSWKVIWVDVDGYNSHNCLNLPWKISWFNFSKMAGIAKARERMRASYYTRWTALPIMIIIVHENFSLAPARFAIAGNNATTMWMHNELALHAQGKP